MAAESPPPIVEKKSGLEVQMLSVPQDLLDCPICCEKMLAAVFQCPSGHIICEDCLEKLQPDAGGSRQCPSCRVALPHVGIRNLVVERLAENCSLPCKYGCGVQAVPSELRKHFRTCGFRPWACPVPRCQHRCAVKDLLEHLLDPAHNLKVLERPDKVVTCSCTASSLEHFWDGRHEGADLLKTSSGVFLWKGISSEPHWFKGNLYHFEEPVRFRITIYNNFDNVSVSGFTTHIAGEESARPFQFHKDQVAWLGFVDGGRYHLRVEVAFLQ